MVFVKWSLHGGRCILSVVWWSFHSSHCIGVAVWRSEKISSEANFSILKESLYRLGTRREYISEF